MAELRRLPDVAMVAVRRRSPEGLPRIGTSADQPNGRVIALGPDEWLVIGPDQDAAALTAAWRGDDGVCVDVSGNRVIYRLLGSDAATVLAAGCALDIGSLRPGDAVSTMLARAGVIILCEDEGFLILPRRSFAGYLEAWLAAASA